MKKVIVIVGPTASGKSSLAIKLAKVLNTEIISGDSVQVYKELNIGSAKVTYDEQKEVKHHLINVTTLDNPYNVSLFQKDGRKIIEHLDIPIVCGGTGFYIQSLLYDYEFLPLEHEKINNIKTKEDLKKLNPNLDIDFDNPRRVQSAINLARYGINRNELNKANNLLYNPLIIYLNIDKSKINERLRPRVYKQIEDGFIDEVKGLGKDLNMIGYKQIYKYINNEYKLEDAIDEIVIKSRQFAKRQKTWFLNKMDVNKFEHDDPLLFEKVLKLSNEFLNEEVSK